MYTTKYEPKTDQRRMEVKHISNFAFSCIRLHVIANALEKIDKKVRKIEFTLKIFKNNALAFAEIV